jgi:hypothetical protein
MDALTKSEQARKDAEAAGAQPQAKDHESKKTSSSLNLNLPAISSKPRLFLADIGSSSRWTIYGTGGNCGNQDQNYFSMASDGSSIGWYGGSGNVEVESVLFSAENEFRTTTRLSRHIRNETSYKAGTTWTYLREGERMHVRSSLGHDLMLDRCP